MIQSLNGLRGWACMIVFLGHLVTPMFPVIHSQKTADARNLIDWLIAKSVLNVFVNGTFAVIIFFILSGFVLSVSYFTSWDKMTVVCAASRRYFRLTIPVLPVILLAFVLQKYNAFHLADVSQLTGHHAMISQFDFTPDLLHMLSVTFSYDADLVRYNESLWTLRYELWGSAMIYSILLLCGQSRLRYFLYLTILAYWTYWDDYYIKCMITGMLLADIHYTIQSKTTVDGLFQQIFFILLFVFGLYLGAYPVHHADPSPFQASILQWGAWFGLRQAIDYYYLVGAGAILIAILHSHPLSRFFSNKVSTFLGDISFSLYLIHWPLEASGGFQLFLSCLKNGYTYNESVAIYMVITIPVILYLSYLFSILVDFPTIRGLKTICGRIMRHLTSRTGWPPRIQATFGDREVFR